MQEHCIIRFWSGKVGVVSKLIPSVREDGDSGLWRVRWSRASARRASSGSPGQGRAVEAAARLHRAAPASKFPRSCMLAAPVDNRGVSQTVTILLISSTVNVWLRLARSCKALGRAGQVMLQQGCTAQPQPANFLGHACLLHLQTTGQSHNFVTDLPDQMTLHCGAKTVDCI